MAKPEAELKKAVKTGNLETVRQLIADGLPVDSELPAKVTALEFALASEKGEIVWELLRLGARPRPQRNDNLLLDAPKFRDLKLLRRLVELGADVHAPDRAMQTPLLCAVAAGFYDAVRFLLDQGADPLARDKRGSSVFQRSQDTRQFCSGLLPGAEGEVAELFRSQLADLDRIEELLESVLTPEQVDRLRGKPARQPEPSTFWQLKGDLQFSLELAPFPFTSQAKSRLNGRLGRIATEWAEFFANEGQILFRVRRTREVGEWIPFSPERRDGKNLLFAQTVQLPPGQVTIEIRFEPGDLFSGELEGWKIYVAE